MSNVKCEIVDSSALGKAFKYCRTHKREANNDTSCATVAPPDEGTPPTTPNKYGDYYFLRQYLEEEKREF